MLNDIAIIKLKNKVNFNKRIQPACLPNEKNFNGISAWTYGFKSTKILKSFKNVKLSIYNSDKCKNVITSFSKNWTSQICGGKIV